LRKMDHYIGEFSIFCDEKPFLCLVAKHASSEQCDKQRTGTVDCGYYV